jgi:hypothetical protein
LDDFFVLAVQEDVPHKLVAKGLGILHADNLHQCHQSLYLNPIVLIVLEDQKFLEDVELFQ